MPGRLRSAHREVEAAGAGRTQQVGERDREQEAQNDGTQQSAEREEGRTGKILRGDGKFEQSGGRAKGTHQ